MKRERITITLSKELLDKIDSVIDGSNLRNRSHAIEYFVGKSIGPTMNSALILAGDKKIRLNPLTRRIPKVMTPLRKKPLAEHMIKWLKEYGLTRIIFGVGYKKEKIENHFGNGSKLGVNILYSGGVGKKPEALSYLLGAKDYLKDNRFLVLEGDVMIKMDLKSMLKFHEQNNALVTIAVKSVPKPCSNVVELEGFKVVNLQEKPKKEPNSNLVYAGVCIMEPRVFDYLDVVPFLEEDLFQLIASKGGLYGYPFVGPWIRITNPNDVKLAEKVL